MSLTQETSKFAKSSIIETEITVVVYISMKLLLHLRFTSPDVSIYDPFFTLSPLNSWATADNLRHGFIYNTANVTKLQRNVHDVLFFVFLTSCFFRLMKQTKTPRYRRRTTPPLRQRPQRPVTLWKVCSADRAPPVSGTSEHQNIRQQKDLVTTSC